MKEPLYQVGDKVISKMNGPYYATIGTVTEVRPGRGGQRFCYLVAIEAEFPETGIAPASEKIQKVLE